VSLTHMATVELLATLRAVGNCYCERMVQMTAACTAAAAFARCFRVILYPLPKRIDVSFLFSHLGGFLFY
jgi:hypothetical protein